MEVGLDRDLKFVCPCRVAVLGEESLLCNSKSLNIYPMVRGISYCSCFLYIFVSYLPNSYAMVLHAPHSSTILKER